LLEEAIAQPVPLQHAFAASGSAAQQSEDLQAIDNARILLGDLVRVSHHFVLSLSLLDFASYIPFVSLHLMLHLTLVLSLSLETDAMQRVDR
jgi:hypothetical protein